MDLALAMHAAAKLDAARDVMLCGRSPYWKLRNQLRLFGLESSTGGERVLGLFRDAAEASAFARADILTRISPLVAGASIKFSVAGKELHEDPEQGTADAAAAPGPVVVEED